MNSLSYLSRQLDTSLSRSSSSDYLAQQQSSSSSPPSTSPLKRSKSWSKPFFFRGRIRKPVVILDDDSDIEESDDYRRRKAKRSFSSPALFNGSSAVLKRTAPPSVPSKPVSAISSSPSSPHLVMKESYLYRRLNRLFLLRAFAIVWNALCATYERIMLPPLIRVRMRHTPVEDELETTSADEKDSDDEMVIMSPVTRAPIRPVRSLLSAPLTPKEEPSQAVIPFPTPSATPSPLPTPSPTPPPSNALRRPTTPFHLPKTLVLDLDETLIHSTSRPMRSGGGSGFFGFEFGGKRIGSGHVVEVVLNGRTTLYHVYKRPFVDYFLRKVSTWYTLVVFTASMQEYADPVIDWLDAGKGILSRRLFRDSCTQLPSGSYTKDLSLVGGDLSRVCLVDNSPVCYSVNPANGIPIEGWTHDLSDEALLDLLPVLDSLRFTEDVRRVLGLRGFS